MRATRNRVYGVTRIGGSNPSSSANLEKAPCFKQGAFFVAEEPFQTAPAGLSSTDGIMSWASKFAAVAYAFLAY